MKTVTEARSAARINLACQYFQARLDRAMFFNSSLFSDAAWDILLSLYIYEAVGHSLSAGELCRYTCETSLTTSLRMQRRLADLGLIRRQAHSSDRRRLIIELTDEGRKQLEEYLDHELVTPRAGSQAQAEQPWILRSIKR